MLYEVFKQLFIIELSRNAIENLALARNWITSKGQPDTERTSVYILRDFREGKIGKFILDTEASDE